MTDFSTCQEMEWDNSLRPEHVAPARVLNPEIPRRDIHNGLTAPRDLSRH